MTPAGVAPTKESSGQPFSAGARRGAALLARLRQTPLPADGGTGTQLYALGVDYERSFDALVIEDPALVRRVHADYIAAGARVIETNSFGMNAVRLAAHGLAGRVSELASAAARIARDVADEAASEESGGREIWVAGSIGPLGVTLAPVGALDQETARAAFHEQARGLAEGGVDLLLIETMGDLGEACLALSAAQDASDLPVAVMATFGDDGLTASGHGPEEVARILEQAGALAVGANCSTGPAQMLDMVARMAAVASVPVIAMPNAGLPRMEGGRFIYTASPAYLAELAERMVSAGIALVGGCCGTTPEHIAAIAARLEHRGIASRHLHFPNPEPGAPGSIPASMLGPTPLEQAMAETKFLVLARIDPPKGFNMGRLLPALRAVAATHVVDGFVVADSPRAQARMSALAMAAVLRSELDLPTVLSVGCQYRNRVATHSELLGAHALDLRDILVEQGEFQASGDYPDSTVVRDLTDEGLLRLLEGFNHGRDTEGRTLDDATAFHLGGGLDLGGDEYELLRAVEQTRRLIDAGARYLITRPVFDVERLEQFVEWIGGVGVPLLVGVMPLRDARHAAYLHNEVPGIEVPENLLRRLAEDSEGGALEGLRIVSELSAAIAELAAGVVLMASADHPATIAQQVAAIRPSSALSLATP